MDRLLDVLTDSQRQAVTIGADRLAILAGAGSGKTRVLTTRIAYGARVGDLDPNHTLALTFTRRAAGQLRSRLAQIGIDGDVSAGTFHAQAYAQLRTRWDDHRRRAPDLISNRGRLLSRVLPRGLTRIERMAVVAEIDWATARRLTPDSYAAAAERAGRKSGIGPSQIAEYLRDFSQEKRKRNVVDFDDLLEFAITEMADPAYARTQHWRFRHVFVDEFQDVNPLQYQLLRAWLGPDSTLCVVGDANQAIYSWNGADARYLLAFEEHFPGALTVALTDNFRSSPQILAAAAAVLGETGRLKANRPDGPLPTVCAADNATDEAAEIARRVRDRHRPGGRWGHQAILVRTNAQTTLIADALRNAKIPISIRDGAALIDDARVAARLTMLENKTSPLRTFMVDLKTEAAVVVGSEDSPDEPRSSTDLTPENATALLRLAEDHIALEPDSTVRDFIAWVRATLRNDAAATGTDAVEIVTFHAAKGLEWPIVHLAGLEEGLVPISFATTPSSLAEERRLMYVAITRAQNELHCSWARTRRVGDRSVERMPSIYLADIANLAKAGPTGADAAADNLTRVKALRATLNVDAEESTLPEPDDELRDRLRDWRKACALANAVPPYVVFNDRTLDALVQMRPASSDQLREIPGLGAIKVKRYGDALLEVLGTS